MGILFIPTFVAGIILMIKNPDLLRKRLNTEEKESEQKHVMKELPEGTYYVCIAVVKQGLYIEPENKYEYSDTDCVFKLVMDQ